MMTKAEREIDRAKADVWAARLDFWAACIDVDTRRTDEGVAAEAAAAAVLDELIVRLKQIDPPRGTPISGNGWWAGEGINA